ncbi:MAG: hypothetical protein M3R13_01370 [Armatimonadota bacterium]|nr:hypothetical protein [Armatimonadota bacterium]
MKDWNYKLEAEEPLSAGEEARLDEALLSPDQARIKTALRELPALTAPASIATSFSRRVLAWRRKRIGVMSGLSGLATAAVAMIVIYRGPAPAPVLPETPTTSLYDWHYEAVATSVLPGDGANLAGFSQVAKGESAARQ